MNNLAKSPKGEQSRQVILQAARQLIAQNGFNAITLQDILHATDVTKGKFFHHFESKDELFSTLLRESLAERAVVNFNEFVAACSSENPFEQLCFVLDRLIDWHKKGLPEGMRLCLFATFFFPPSSPEMKQIQSILKANASVLEDLIRNCQAQRLLPQELDASVLSLLLPSASVGGNIVGHLCKHKSLTPENLIQLRMMLTLLHKQFVKNPNECAL